MVENPGNLLVSSHGELIGRVGGEPAISFDLLGAYPDERDFDDNDCIWQSPDVVGDARRMEGDPKYAGVLYGRVIPGKQGRCWLQYWFWFYYNPKNLRGFGKHEGDWEMIQIELDADGEPDVLAYAQHKHGEVRKASDKRVEWADPDAKRHPVVYVAPLSHASYFQARSHPYFPGIDPPYGDGPEDVLPVEPFDSWNEWPGRWGSREHMVAGGRFGGEPPRSPSKQGKWKDPAGWQRKKPRWNLQLVVRWLLHGPGRLFYPKAPELTARLEGTRCTVEYELRQRPWRRSRHLHLSVHDGDRVVASRTVPCAAGKPKPQVFRLPEAPSDPRVFGTTWNRLRQRSELKPATLTRTPT
jgi:hypothetical protein